MLSHYTIFYSLKMRKNEPISDMLAKIFYMNFSAIIYMRTIVLNFIAVITTFRCCTTDLMGYGQLGNVWGL